MQVNNNQPIFSQPSAPCHQQQPQQFFPQQPQQQQFSFNNPQQFLQDVNQGFSQLNQNWQGIGGGAPAGAQFGQAGGGQAGGRTRVAVIDDFQSGHGQRMEQTLNQSGADTLRFDVSQGGNRTTMIANALQDVAARLDRGEDVDAISLSQQDFGTGPDTARIQGLMQYIQQKHGVPVVVAAGNAGPNGRNQLANGAALVASNAAPGSDFLDPNSGLGNILQAAPTTSDAAALVAARAAQLRNQGFGLQNIVGSLQQQANFEGGALGF